MSAAQVFDAAPLQPLNNTKVTPKYRILRENKKEDKHAAQLQLRTRCLIKCLKEAKKCITLKNV